MMSGGFSAVDSSARSDGGVSRHRAPLSSAQRTTDRQKSWDWASGVITRYFGVQSFSIAVATTLRPSAMNSESSDRYFLVFSDRIVLKRLFCVLSIRCMPQDLILKLAAFAV